MQLTRLWAQIIKELLSLLRDPRSRVILVVPPLLQLCIFAFAATLEVKNADVALFSQDQGAPAVRLVNAISHASFVGKVIEVQGQQQLRSLLDNRQVLLAVHIPQDYSRKLLLGKTGQVQVLLDGRRANAAQIAFGYLQQIASGLNSQIDPVALRHHFNPNLLYRWFVVPGLAGILAMFIALVVTALSIARERELGTFDQLLVSPSTPLEIIIAKCLPAVLVGSMLGLTMVLAARFVFAVPFSGHALWLLLSLLVFILSIVGIGLMISALAATQQQAILGAFAVGVPMILMSGFATPVENMPSTLQWIAQMLPLTHFLVIVQGSFLKALPVAVIIQHLWPMALAALVSLSLATVMVKSRLQ
ncbi:ABC transporter permease [Gallaecimonas mangrovi]|uniref:ABC transporter permease n=1 Tax=Gallaecimonas mangrovi TaxID=2291597 RepID=UPI000E20C149|nr:ABC transporter permease [Gallaecimonas mangrovi]